MIVKVGSPSIMSLRQLDVFVVPYELPVGLPQKQAFLQVVLHLQGRREPAAQLQASGWLTREIVLTLLPAL